MNLSIQWFLDAVNVGSHNAEIIKTYGNCLKKFEKFTSSKYQINVEQIASEIKSGKDNVYEIFNEFVIFQNEMGHGFYLDTYYVLSEEKKNQMFLDAESHITISDFNLIEKNLEMMLRKYNEMESKMNKLIEIIEEKQIMVTIDLK